MRGKHWNIEIPITMHICDITSGLLYSEAHMPVCEEVQISVVSCRRKSKQKKLNMIFDLY